MTLDELRTLAREQLHDEAEPYFCSDERLNAYLNEAEREACIRAKLLYDASRSVALVADQATYVLSVAGAQFFLLDRFALGGVNTYRPLPTSTIHQMDVLHPGWEEAASGVPEVVLMDQSPQKLRLWPAPWSDLAGVPLRLRGYRLPQRPMTADNDSPEIDPVWHDYLIDWARYRFYNTHDSDMYDPALAEKHLAKFERRFGVRPSADLQSLMARRETMPIVPRMMF